VLHDQQQRKHQNAEECTKKCSRYGNATDNIGVRGEPRFWLNLPNASNSMPAVTGNM
jgi:hypothetical protein